MSDLKFSVPYNNDFELLKRFIEIKKLNGNRIEEIYLPIPQKYFGSGRVVDKITKEGLKKILHFSNENNLEVNLLLNSTCEGLDWYNSKNISKILDFLNEMVKKGLDSVTVANPLFLQKIHKELPKLKIHVSVLSDVSSVQRAEFFKKLGGHMITPNRDINRNLEALKQIKKLDNINLKLLVNEGCLFECPYRSFHFNYLSHASKKKEESSFLFLSRCPHIYKSSPSQILKSNWIRPEDLEKYKNITSNFKIAGRTQKSDWILKVVKSYMNQSHEGNLLGLMDGPLKWLKETSDIYLNNKDLGGFFEKVTACNENCNECTYCKELAEKLLA